MTSTPDTPDVRLDDGAATTTAAAAVAAKLVAATRADEATRFILRDYIGRVDGAVRFDALTASYQRVKADRDLLDEKLRTVLAEADRGDGPTVDDPDGGLVRALAAAQGAFPKIAKSQTAKIPGKNGATGYEYSYADLADVLSAVRPVLAAEGLALTQTTRYVDGGGLMLVTDLRHTGGGVLTSVVALGQNPSSPQAFGGALTYLRRYEACSLLGIAAEDDTDAQHVPEPGRAAAPAPRPAEVPPWARPSGDDVKSAMVRALEPLVGRGEAIALGKSIAEQIGHVPHVVAHFAIELRAIMDRLAESPAAPAVRAEQDAAATTPDTPTPDGPAPDEAPAPPAGDTDPAAPGPQRMVVRGSDAEDGHHAWAAEQSDAELDAAAMTLESARGTVHPGYVAAARLERKRRRDANAPGPGTVDVDTSQCETATEAAGVLRAHGCRCDAPDDVFAGTGEPDPTCPIAGHGTPVA